VSEEHELAEALAVANEDRARLRAELERAKRQAKTASEERAEAERSLRRLEGSRSWRLTAPLRGLGEAVRSLSRRRG
jgi:hypothetical protein